MMIFYAPIEDLYEPFNAARHAVNGLDPISVRQVLLENIVCKITLEIPPMGWAVNHPSRPKNYIISVSDSYDPAEAYPIARGYVDPKPGNIFAARTTLELICGPRDYKEKVLAYAKAHLSSAPETDLLADDADPEDPETYLKGHSRVYVCDPLTHEFSTSDILIGDRIINMSDSHRHDKSVEPEAEFDEPPVTTARLLLTADWDEEARGACNIGGRVFPIASLDAKGGYDEDIPSTALQMNLGAGWNLERSRCMRSQSESGPFSTGVRARYDVEVYGTVHTGTDIYGEPTYEARLIRRFQRVHARFDTVPIYHYSYGDIWMRFEWSQPRSERAYLVMTAGAQTSVVDESDGELDLGSYGTTDLKKDTTSEPWERGTLYKVGERVQKGGTVYECLVEHVSWLINQQNKDNLPPQVIKNPVNLPQASPHPLWKRVNSNAALKYSWSPEFFATDRGRTYIEHGLCRLRKAIRQRLRWMRVPLTYPWELAKDITMRDSLRVEVPSGLPDGSTRELIGKVIGIERPWNSNGATAVVTIGVAFGTGEDETPSGSTSNGYVESGYVESGYFETDSNDPSISVVGSDISYATKSAKLFRKVDGGALPFSSYSVTRASRAWEAGAQLGELWRQAGAGRSPSIPRTQISISMRDLSSDTLPPRDFDVAAELSKSPKGIDMGGE